MTESIWNGFRHIDFTFEGREAILVFPDENKRKAFWHLVTSEHSTFSRQDLIDLGVSRYELSKMIRLLKEHLK